MRISIQARIAGEGSQPSKVITVGVVERQDSFAPAAGGRDSSLAAPLLDLCARSAFPSQGRAHPGTVRAALARAVAAQGRVRHLHRREDQHPGSAAHASKPAHRAGQAPARGARVRTRWRLGVLAALDGHRAKVFGREATTGIAPFERLVDQVMGQPPYVNARRVFWVVDNGSSHRGDASVRRLTHAHPRLVPVHAPVHACWLNQIEIYFSIVQRRC